MGKEDFTAKMYDDGKVVIPFTQRKLFNIEMDDLVTLRVIDVTKKDDIPTKAISKEETSL